MEKVHLNEFMGFEDRSAFHLREINCFNLSRVPSMHFQFLSLFTPLLPQQTSICILNPEN